MAVILVLWSIASIAYAWDANNKDTVIDYIHFVALKEGVNTGTALAIANCESGFNKDALHVSPKERSVGIFQINLLAHKDITEAEAKNPFLNVNWAIDQMAKGLFSMWTCYDLSKS